MTLRRDLSKDTVDYSGSRKLKSAFRHVYSQLIVFWLQEGKLEPHPYQLIGGSLAGLERALKALKELKNAAMKDVLRIVDRLGLARCFLVYRIGVAIVARVVVWLLILAIEYCPFDIGIICVCR